MATLDEFWNDLLNGLGELVETHLLAHKDNALKGAEDFLKASELDIRKYTSLLASDKINRNDYYWLLKSRLDLAKLHALTEAGIAQVKLEHFRIALIDYTVGAAFRFINTLV